MKENRLMKECLKHKEFLSLVFLQALFEARPREVRSVSREGT